MQHVLNSPGTVDITAEEYVRLQRASESIIQAVSLEEKFDILLGNFVELETDLLAAATRNAVYEKYDYVTLRTERNFIVSRRFLNLLAASRAYLDQGAHDLIRIVEPNDGTLTDFSAIFKKYTKKEYDTILGYRVMEAVKNYIEHRGFPIYTSYEERSVHIPDRDAWVHHVKPQIYLKVLGADPILSERYSPNLKKG
jgi:hypothetical protein